MDPRSTAPLGHASARRYTLEDGLAGMLVEDIYQDRRGLLWIATADGGVSRFDGEAFETFQLAEGLPHLTVMAIAEDAEGRLWFGTLGGGLAAFDGGEFRVYTTEHGLPSNEIMGLRPQADGSMRVLTGEGIGRFADERCVERTMEIGGQPIGRVHDMVTDTTGTTWLATRERGIISLEGRSLSPVFAPGGAHHWAWNFTQDDSGHVWIASFHRKKEAVIPRYDPRDESLDMVEVKASTRAGEVLPPGTGQIRHVRMDPEGRLWMCCRDVVVHDGRGWHSVSAAFPHVGLARVRLTYEDREGNLWIGCWSGGLVLCCLGGLRRYTEADGLPYDRVRALAEDRRGRIWSGTRRGLACLEEERTHATRMSPGVSALEVDRQGTLWLGGRDGTVAKVGGKEPRVIARLAEDDHDAIQSFCEDHTGRLWACTSNGLLGHVEKDRFVPLERLPAGGRTLRRGREGLLWIGTSRGVLALQYPHRLHVCEFEGLEAATVNALCEQEGTLWVGTISGLHAVDLRSGRVRRSAMDLDPPANCIRALETDSKGQLWIGTNGGGVARYDGEVFHSIRLGDSPPANAADAILCDRRGHLWFGGTGGLTRYRPHRTPPAIVIRQVLEGRLREASESVSLPTDASEIEVHFQGVRFRIDQQPMRYSHRLIGYDPAAQWSPFRPRNTVSFKDLPIGEYRLEARTRDPEGHVSEAARLRIRVLRETDGDGTRTTSEEGIPLEPDAGRSPTIARLLWKLKGVAGTDMTVLLRGETGTGKGLVAREIHGLSRRREQAFIHVNCGSLSSSLVESELFGHERGAFTGAVKRKVGLIEHARGGTLFLDEVGELPSEGQRALLKFLDDGLMRRVGGVEPFPADVRLIVATHEDLEEMVKAETFREDLYYRLRAFPVLVPPLRERREEIPMLAAHFAAEYASQLRRPPPTLSAEALEHLQQHTWPGNVRELEHLVRRGMMLGESGTLEAPQLALSTDAKAPGAPAREADGWNEKLQIMEALEAAGGRIYGKFGAARLLGMNPERLRSRMRVHKLQKPKKS